MSATFDVRPADRTAAKSEQYYTPFKADNPVAVGAVSIGGHDSASSPPESDSRRKPVFTFMKGTAMPRTDFADRSLLTAPLT
jgi:hypothetical protein